MKHYKLSEMQTSTTGWTDMFQLELADLGSFATVNVTLTSLIKGDVVDRALIEVPTAQVGTTGTPVCQVKVLSGPLITGTVNPASAFGVMTDNSVVGTNVIQAATDTLVLALTGGTGGTPTAGQITVWAKILRKNMRDMVQR